MAKRLLQKAGLKLKCQTSDQQLLQQPSLISQRLFSGINYQQYFQLQQSPEFFKNPELTSIFDSVYLGDYEDACDLDKLKKVSITNIINCDPFNCENLFPHNFTYNNVEMKDNSQFDITNCIEITIKIIKQIQNNNGKVLIHCSKGISRAPAIALAYIISEKQMNVAESLRFLKSKYQKADPNVGFMIQLNDFYKNQSNIISTKI